MNLYETDFYAWANEQAALLRGDNLSAADIANIAEELESMGKTQKHELIRRLIVLLLHLLKWKYQSRLRGRSWRITIWRQRDDIADHLQENPSLKAILDDVISTAYRKARIEAENETRLPVSAFPDTCPWSWIQIIDQEFWPN